MNDISAFQRAAAQNAGRLTLRTEDGVVRGAGGLRELFRWGSCASVKEDNRRVALAFRQALVAAYGEKNMADAFSKTVSLRQISAGQPISSRQVRTVLRDVEAVREQAERLLLARCKTPGLSDEVYQAPPLDNLLAWARLPQLSQVVLDQTRLALATTTNLLSEVPVTEEGHASFVARAVELRAVLRRLLDESHGLPPSRATEDLLRELPRAVGDINAKLIYVDRLRVDHPATAASVLNAREHWYAAALACLDATLAERTVPEERLGPLVRAKASLLQARDADRQRLADNARVSGLKQELGGLPGDLHALLSHTLRGLHTKAEVRAMLEEHWVRRLNEGQPWGTIRHAVPLTLNGARLTPVSEVRPAAALGNIFTSSYGGKGVCAYSFAENRHAVNLASSSLTLPDPDGRDRVLFAGVRHAAHCATDIADPEERRAANLARATECVTAALTGNPALLKAALEAPDGSPPTRIPMVSLSLLTPDALRGSGFINFFKNMRHDNEAAILREQTEAWRALNAMPVRITVLDAQGREREITVQPEVITFNFGVNSGALTMPRLSNIVGGWGASDRLNGPALVELEARVRAFLASDAPGAERKDRVRQLFDQIAAMRDDASYRRMGAEPYKMVSRIAVLAHLMGETPVWNCKSGKDRTGNMDVEAKFLALRMAAEGRAPEPDAPLNGEARAALRALALGSGNLELQRLNTGVPGFKLEGVWANTERLGEPEARSYFRGASPFIRG